MTDLTGQTGTVDNLPTETLRAVVELQRTELNRLLREQSRLNDRIDSLLQLHEREQVLRQQMQASLDRLGASQREVSRQTAMLKHEPGPDVADLRARLERTESRFSALQGAVGELIAYIERKVPDGGGGDGGFVRVFAPG
jgi:chromosome segregation ATPase